MKNKIFSILMTGVFVAVAAILLPISSNAQLRYQSRYTKMQVGQTIRQLESTSTTFKHDFDNALDHSRINGSSREDDYNRLVKDYVNSLDRLRKEFDRTDSWWTIRNYASDTISKASAVNDIINQLSFRRNVERQWGSLRNDLNSVADTFDLPGLNGGGWTGGSWNGGNNGVGPMSRPPSWNVGTFYGRSNDGQQISLTIADSGYVTASINGSNSYGAYNRGIITINGANARISQAGDGFRTTRVDNGEVITYSRNGWGNGNGTWGGGQKSTPPSWAVGTFYGNAPDGSRIMLSIVQDGSVTATINGNNSYGTFYRGNIVINGASSHLTQRGNGLSTTRTDNGEVITYGRNNWDGGGVNGGNSGTPVNWAVGSFSAPNPQSGGSIYLTINGNGQVTVNMDGNTVYGTMNGTTLMINGATSTVTRDGNGIRTTRNDNGERINYRRN